MTSKKQQPGADGISPPSGAPSVTPRPATGSTKRKTNNLVALGAAAVLAVYAAGYTRTRAAAEAFADPSRERRPPAVSAAASDAAHDQTAQRVDQRKRTSESATAGDSSQSPVVPKQQNLPAPAVQPVAQSIAKPLPKAAPTDSQTLLSSAAPANAPSTAPPPVPVVDSSSPPVSGVPATTPPAGAQASQTTDSTAQTPDKEKSLLKDGVYSGYGTSRHGDIEASVEIRGGRIVAASISQCLTRYSCQWISHLPGQVVARQSPDVDFVSGATQSTNAFYYAVFQALSKAK